MRAKRAHSIGPPPMSDPGADLAAVARTAWDLLEDGAATWSAPMHTVALATIARDGRPAVRTVVLRAADRTTWSLRLYTDTRSAKYAELTRDPRAELHAYDPARKVQLRARGTATLHNRDALARETWGTTRPASRECYHQPVCPGATIAAPDGAEGPPLSAADGLAHFAVVVLKVAALEWLFLAPTGHRRAEIEPHAARWLAP